MCKPHRRLVSFKELRTEFGIPLCYTQIKRLMFPVSGPALFPLAVRLGPHGNSRVAWYADEIADYVEALEATRALAWKKRQDGANPARV